ncbi:hypothetical protein KCU65_g369, partial [Aureobasidium melanogenum]
MIAAAVTSAASNMAKVYHTNIHDSIDDKAHNDYRWHRLYNGHEELDLTRSKTSLAVTSGNSFISSFFSMLVEESSKETKNF